MTRTYPGMLDHSIEYFAQGSEVFKIKDGKVTPFSQVPEHPELEAILKDEPETAKVLKEMCGSTRKTQLKKLAACRFGGLNFDADFSAEGNIHDFFDCPNRGKCIGENIVCKPLEINDEIVTPQEINLLRECVTSTKNWVIALNMNLPLGTFNVMKTSIYKKLGIETKQQSAVTLFEKGLL